MTTLRKLSLAVAFAALTVGAAAQNADPMGVVTYALPRTVVRLQVQADVEQFHAGPYAKFAQKYLGTEARSADASSCVVTDIKMTPLAEADQSRRYSVVPGTSTSFLALTAQGLISVGAGAADDTQWRFPSPKAADFTDKGLSSNLTSESTVLYRNVKGSSNVAVQQNMVVEKSLDAKAKEAADMIFRLRAKKVQIVTGDTDATFSGEALGAAIAEIDRLEKEYLSLFVGYSDVQTQKMNFDVVPTLENKKQIYVAFRLSDSEGLVSPDNVSGKPYLLEFVPATVPVSGEASRGAVKGNVAYYKIPAICAVKLTDGVKVLLSSRIPVYQLGLTSTLTLGAK